MANALIKNKGFCYHYPMITSNIDTHKWKRRAMAFAVRAHNHLWGKNNEDPLVFLFQNGLNHDFSRQMYLGWNKFGQERPYDSWGIHREGKFIIPPGIVFPYIIDQKLISLFIIPFENEKKGGGSPFFSFPGNPDLPIILGNPAHETKIYKDLLKGLNMFQDDPDAFCINILKNP